MELENVKAILTKLNITVIEPDMKASVEKMEKTGRVLAAYPIFLGKEGEEEKHLTNYFKHNHQYKQIWCYKLDLAADNFNWILKAVPLI